MAASNNTYLGLHVKCLIFWPDFNQIWNVMTEFHKSPKYQISRKFAPWESRWYTRTGGRTHTNCWSSCCFYLWARTLAEEYDPHPVKSDRSTNAYVQLKAAPSRELNWYRDVSQWIRLGSVWVTPLAGQNLLNQAAHWWDAQSGSIPAPVYFHAERSLPLFDENCTHSHHSWPDHATNVKIS